ncbi:hypothetical protein HELRODRAFT_192698 [Helobdella robusta]|uniref:Uncharacterized protein n=1 Tax=Helobdella robusta TaxID=6412 RepID=T1FU75_HELRO|nr:hypothetical protein HELRODRAFT_192698 [Helobdella robusta]ESO00016.1 hypothetical protein HELRODRAFT_192698 [Helobdella robusta]
MCSGGRYKLVRSSVINLLAVNHKFNFLSNRLKISPANDSQMYIGTNVGKVVRVFRHNYIKARPKYYQPSYNYVGEVSSFDVCPLEENLVIAAGNNLSQTNLSVCHTLESLYIRNRVLYRIYTGSFRDLYYTGFMLDFFGFYTESIPDLFGIYTRSILDLFGFYTESIPDLFRIYTGSILDLFQILYRIYAGSIPDPNQIDARSFLDLTH